MKENSIRKAKNNIMTNKKKVVFVGDSRKMKGGVSTVMKTLETSWIWDKYKCYWMETQVNSNKIVKVLYLALGWIKSLGVIPFYDIVHFQTVPGFSMIGLLPIFLYSKLWHKRIIVQLHVGNQIKEYMNNPFFQFWTKHAHEVIFLGKMWCNQSRPFIHKSTHTDFLYNPVSTTEKPISAEKFFLFAAYFNPNKGYDIFLNAFSLIAKKYPDWKVVLCGTGDDDLVHDLIDRLDISNQVVLPGWIDGDEKKYYFQSAYAYCMASWKEGLPLSVLEAMSYGVPIITTPVGCLPEFLENKKSAMIFNHGEVKEMADAMEFLINNPIQREVMGHKCLKIISENFTLEKVSKKLDSIYTAI